MAIPSAGFITLFGRAAIHGWRLNKRKAIATALELFETHPLLVVHVSAAITRRSWVFLAMAPIATLANHIVNNISMQYILVGKWLLLRESIYTEFTGARFQPFTLMDYVGLEIASDISDNLVSRLLPTTLVNFVHCFVVEHEKLDLNIQAYHYPLQGGFVFFSDSPSSTDETTRFRILHEFGHCLDYVSSKGRDVFAVIAALFCSLWIVIVGTTSTRTWVLLVVLLSMEFARWLTRKVSSRYRAEVWADLLAITFLNTSDAIELHRQEEVMERLVG